MIRPFIKSSFDTLLKLQEVMDFNELAGMFPETQAEIPRGKSQAGFRNGSVGSAVLGGRQQRWILG